MLKLLLSSVTFQKLHNFPSSFNVKVDSCEKAISSTKVESPRFIMSSENSYSSFKVVLVHFLNTKIANRYNSITLRIYIYIYRIRGNSYCLAGVPRWFFTEGLSNFSLFLFICYGGWLSRNRIPFTESNGSTDNRFKISQLISDFLHCEMFF